MDLSSVHHLLHSPGYWPLLVQVPTTALGIVNAKDEIKNKNLKEKNIIFCHVEVKKRPYIAHRAVVHSVSSILCYNLFYSVLLCYTLLYSVREPVKNVLAEFVR